MDKAKEYANRFKQWVLHIVISRYTDYNELVEENKKLKKDIYKLVKQASQEEGIITRMQYSLEFDWEKMFWVLDENIKDNPKKFEGLWKQTEKLNGL